MSRRYSYKDLTSRVTFESATYVDDAYGGQTITWDTAFSRWAHLVPQSVRSESLRDSTVILQRRRLVLRYDAAIMHGLRCQLEGGEIFYVFSASPLDGNSRFMACELVKGGEYDAFTR